MFTKTCAVSWGVCVGLNWVKYIHFISCFCNMLVLLFRLLSVSLAARDFCSKLSTFYSLLALCTFSACYYNSLCEFLLLLAMQIVFAYFRNTLLVSRMFCWFLFCSKCSLWLCTHENAETNWIQPKKNARITNFNFVVSMLNARCCCYKNECNA